MTSPSNAANKERAKENLDLVRSGNIALSPADLSLDQLTAAFKDVPLASVPDARLVIAHPPWAGIEDPAAVRLPQSVSGWQAVGVMQRTQDVCLALDIPYLDSPSKASPTSVPSRLRCRIYYNPADDNCVLLNNSESEIHLANLGPQPQRHRLRLRSPGFAVVTPGIWRVTVRGESQAEVLVLDFLVLRRQFLVTMARDAGSSSNKRQHTDSQGPAAAKRRRGDLDTTEIVVAPVAAGGLSTASPQDVVPVSQHGLLDLEDGDVAFVTTAASSQQNTRLAPRGSGGYELQRLGRVAMTCAASVFTARHSALSGNANAVVKVLKYDAKSAKDIIQIARGWKREKSFLEKLKHVNIMGLRASDGRLFSLYLEPLPRSLSRGTPCPLGRDEAEVVLRDMLAALQYLEEQHVIHNDIKPSNIAYSRERGAVLLDFGVATWSSEPATSSGTPWYVPPDLLDNGTRGPPSDVWALGVTLLYVLNKTPPPEAVSPYWIIPDAVAARNGADDVMENWLTQVATIRDEQLVEDSRLERVLIRMLQDDSANRIAAAAAFDMLTLDFDDWLVESP